MRKTYAGVILLALVACSPEYGKGFRSSDIEYMDLFLAQLEKEAIPHNIGSDGMILYKLTDETKVQEIHKKVKARLALVSSLKFEEAEAREYLKALLEEKDLKYSVEERDDGIWIKWYPESKEQEAEVQMAVVQHVFDLKAGTQ